MLDLPQKLAILADAAKYDASCASSGAKRSNRGQGLGDTDGTGICHSYTPDGRCVSLLKILLTNYCIYDCAFCINRVSSDVRRARFSVEDVVWLTMEFYRRNYIEGLFLSSGIIQSPEYTMEQLVEVARRLREDERFFGYIHLKTIPGVDARLIDLAGRYADRLSANVELPTDADLQRLAPEKSLKTVELTMSAIRDRRAESIQLRKRGASAARAPRFAPAGQSTQLIVGASASTDAAILGRASSLYAEQRLRRVYYSAYSPIPSSDARLPAALPPLVREHRLYQADWLMRFYGFDASELTPTGAEDLDLEIDPKLAWALRHRGFFPIDLNIASHAAILRVPGIGTRSASRIVAARRFGKLRVADLKRLRCAASRALPFIVLADHHPSSALLDSPRLRSHVAPPRPTTAAHEPDPEAQPAGLFDALTPRDAASVITGEL